MTLWHIFKMQPILRTVTCFTNQRKISFVLIADGKESTRAFDMKSTTRGSVVQLSSGLATCIMDFKAALDNCALYSSSYCKNNVNLVKSCMKCCIFRFLCSESTSIRHAEDYKVELCPGEWMHWEKPCRMHNYFRKFGAGDCAICAGFNNWKKRAKEAE